ncbi:MAG: hypothetical protein GX995_00690 [Clostridiales bacterium]|nr:hypothetical protein [Clostridiales bacterium]
MDLNHLSFTMETKLFPIIGYPMGQSSASYGYNPLFAGNKIDEVMWPVQVEKGELGDFVKAFKTLGMRNFALTMPYKAEIIPYLDRVDPISEMFNSVNAVKVDEEGRTYGKGFDGIGNMTAIKNAGVDVKGMDVVILGAGSIVGVILLEMAKNGAKKVTLINRTSENSKKLIDKVSDHIDMPVDYLDFTNDNLDKAAKDCDLLMQATALGLYGFPHDYEYLGFLDKINPDAVVMENIVNPPLTKFATKAKSNNLKLIYGIDMMLGQLEDIFEFCFGFKPSPESMEDARESVYSYFKFEK